MGDKESGRIMYTGIGVHFFEWDIIRGLKYKSTKQVKKKLIVRKLKRKPQDRKPTEIESKLNLVLC